jgi:uncharacterized protein (DUF362 family)/Pyruvate/2-oxoacid:ferredoxin oxidoreductase delta subunit
VVIGDGPSVWGNQIEKIEEVFEKTGIKKVAEEEGVELVTFDKRRWHGDFPLTTWIDQVDHIVNVPKFKTHNLTILTAAVKNCYGLVSGTYKTELHKKHFDVEDFSRVLVDIYAKAWPHLTVVDGVMALEGEGPATSGTPRKAEIIAAGADCVAIDAVLAKIMGIEPLEVPVTKEAVGRGIGIADLSRITIVGERIEDLSTAPFILPSTSNNKKLPPFVIKLARTLIKYYPRVMHDRCTRCGICIKACPAKIIRVRKGRIHIEYGKCISCFCCQESCPSAAIKLKKNLFTKLVGL